jgi:hypothetical protein
MQLETRTDGTLPFIPDLPVSRGYRTRFQKISLSWSGEIPAATHDVSVEEHNATLSSVAALWELLTTTAASARRRHPDFTTPTEAETWLAFRRWILSHHLFIPTLSLIAMSLTEAIQLTRSDQPSRALEWIRLAARMRRGCGALCIYGIDFVPCSEIYCKEIRSQMPPAFTGYEIRERQLVVQPAIASFLSLFRNPPNEAQKQAKTIWMEADQRYRDLHQRCMFLAVPVEPGLRAPRSLRQEYLQEGGTSHSITEDEFLQYDSWFGIERSGQITRFDYVHQLSEVMERILADLIVGHRLDDCVLKELLDGMRATLVVFSTWAGEVNELSAFHHRYLRGE